jgi:glycosyltransferase involved in cell wall biosynthesis
MWGVERTGGTVTFTEIGKRLIKKGHKVTITALDDGHGSRTPNGFKPKWEPDIPIEYIPVPQQSKYIRYAIFKLNNHINPYANLREFQRIEQILDYIPDCDINVATYFPSAFTTYLSKKGNAQFYHMQHYEPLFFTSDMLLDRYEKHIAELSYILPLHRIANCSWLKNMVKEKHGVDSSVINHAIRNDIFYPRNIEKSSIFRILCLGKTNVAWKGVQTLASALKLLERKFENFELVLYGGEKYPKLDYPFIYIKNPSWDKLAELYCSSHVIVCPSWFESFPAPPLEGMACGVPVITTPIGVEDYASHRKNCLIVPPKDEISLAKALLELIQDQSLYDHLCQEGLQTAKFFTWDRTTELVEELFVNTIENNHD